MIPTETRFKMYYNRSDSSYLFGGRMTISHFLYNAFTIEHRSLRIAIDPGADLFLFRFKPLIPTDSWKSFTHTFVTHADPDHHWYTDKVAAASGSPIICGRGMTRTRGEKTYLLGPRSRGLAFDYEPPLLHSISVGETLEITPELSVTGIPARHGPLSFRFGPFKKTFRPGPTERIGYGAIGFVIQIENTSIVNLGDTLFLGDQWSSINEPDVLMIPIGGDLIGNTMGIDDALKVVRQIQPRIVIPCHFNIPSFFRINGNPTDVSLFVREIEESGSECRILTRGESIVI